MLSPWETDKNKFIRVKFEEHSLLTASFWEWSKLPSSFISEMIERDDI